MLESQKIFYTFGKYKGKSLKYVFDYDESYFSWSYFSAPQFKKMISECSDEFKQCVKIIAHNYEIKKHNKILTYCMQPLNKYIKNPNFFKFFKEGEVKEKIQHYYSYDDCLNDENDDTFEQDDNDMHNNVF